MLKTCRLRWMLVASLLILTMPGCMSCETVSPGYVGIRVNMYGSDKGVEDLPLETGRVWYNMMTENVYVFPTFLQNKVWAKHDEENDESITFNTKEGASINTDVAISYSVDRDKVPSIFKRFRKDIDHISDMYIRPKVRDAFNETASKMQAADVIGDKKSELLTVVTKKLRDELGPQGITVDSVSLVGRFRLDPRVEQSINATIEATQRAIEAENKVRQSKAEAEQAVAEAEGKARSIEVDAKARSNAILMQANAKAQANTNLAKSLTPELVRYEALQKWDGTLPKFSGGGAVPFINVSDTDEHPAKK